MFYEVESPDSLKSDFRQPKKTKLVYIAHADIGGQIPLKVVESAVPSAIVTFYTGLKEELGLKN